MPFAVTCPKCQAKFRSKAARPIGKGVECKDCGEQFYVSEENQSELVADQPLKRRLRTDEDEPRRRPRDGDMADEPPAARRRRPADDRNDFDRPRRKAGGKKVLALALGFVGLVVVAGGGITAYFLFFTGGGESAENKARPKRDLPFNLLVYRPSEGASVDIYNFGIMREPECGDTPPYTDGFLPPAHGLKNNDIEFFIHLTDSADNQIPQVTAIQLTAPLDIAAFTQRCNLKQMEGKRTGVYSSSGINQPRTWVVLQPAPNQLVVVNSQIGKKPDLNAMAAIADQNADSIPFPSEMKESVEAVSGYPSIHVSPKTKFSEAYVTGRYVKKSGEREEFSIRIHDSVEAAKTKFEEQKKFWLAADAVSKSGSSKPNLWIRGNRTFFFHTIQMGKGKAS
jgi:hypothetical protein